MLRASQTVCNYISIILTYYPISIYLSKKINMKIITSEEEFLRSKGKNKITCECYHCKISFDIDKKYILRELKYNRGNHKFCSSSCSNKYYLINRLKLLLKDEIDAGLTKIIGVENGSVLYQYKCENCGLDFIDKLRKKGRKKTCSECRCTRVIKKIENINNIYELSTRTIQKIIKRAKINCAICGWDKTTLDIHHINGRKIDNPDNHTNLVCLCPNCHRLAHEHKISKNELTKVSLDKLLVNWRDYYNKL